MKIIRNKYPEEANWTKYLTLKSNEPYTQNVNAVFIRRLAAFVRDKCPGKKITFSSVSRSPADSIRIYNESEKGSASTPGTSWHCHACAVDLSYDSKMLTNIRSNWTQFISKSNIPDQDMYDEYGICFTMGNQYGYPEDWHVQVREASSSGVSKEKRAFWLDVDDLYITETGMRNLTLSSSSTTWDGHRLYMSGNDVFFLQECLSITKTGIYDDNTYSAVISYQTNNGLSPSGICNQETWKRLLLTKPIPKITSYTSTTLFATKQTSDISSTGSTSSNDEFYNEDIAPKKWQNYSTGEKGVMATEYLEKVRNIEVQEKRAEAIAEVNMKRKYQKGFTDESIEYTEEYKKHIDKWETILNSKNEKAGLGNTQELLYGKTSNQVPESTLTREDYINGCISELNSYGDMYSDKLYSSISTIPVLNNMFSVTTLDNLDSWRGMGRKDLLFYLYLIALEIEDLIKKKGNSYNKLVVSLARNKETLALEHYCGIAADLYLPTGTNNGIIDSDTIADIIYSMGIKNIGIGKDYVHFDLAGGEEKIWAIDNYSFRTRQLRDLVKTANIKKTEEFI